MAKYFLFVAHGSVSEAYLRDEGDDLASLRQKSMNYPQDENLWNNYCWIEDQQGTVLWDRDFPKSL